MDDRKVRRRSTQEASLVISTYRFRSSFDLRLVRNTEPVTTEHVPDRSP